MSEQRVKPTVMLPDTSPLVHLAAVQALHVLNGFGRVVVVDVVAFEATHDLTGPYAGEIAAWIVAGQMEGSSGICGSSQFYAGSYLGIYPLAN